jgi:hypothetical protein
VKEGEDMDRTLLLWTCLVLALAGSAVAKEKEAGKGAPAAAPEAKQLSGMSIVGNDEAPKSLYIVPWKRSEIGAETTLHKMLTEQADPVDREEFGRQVEFYESSTRK